MLNLRSKSIITCIVIAAIAVLLNVVGIPGGGVKKVNAAMYEFYVAADGDDSTGDGSLSSPWATITKARDYIESNGLNDNMTGDIIVKIRGGKYYLDESITLNENDSGTNGYNVIYKNYQNEEPVIYGGQRITNWTLESGNIYKSYVGTNWEFYNLTENGEGAIMARFPNGQSYNNGYLYNHSVSSITEFYYKSGDISTFDYDDAVVVHWYDNPGMDYVCDICPIESINFSTRKITMNPGPTRIFNNGGRYYLRNSKDFLDQKGEYYLDESSGYLYYIPRETPIGDQHIVGAKTKRIFEIKGSSSSDLVQHIKIEGLTLNTSDFDKNYYRPNTNYIKVQSQHAIVFLENAKYCTIQNCKILNAGYSGVFLNHYAQENTVYGNRIENCGNQAVVLNGHEVGTGGFSSAAESYVNKNNTVSNNIIYRTGHIVPHSGGVYIYQSGDNEVSYNDISVIPRAAINVLGWRYGVMEDSYYGTSVTYANHWDFLNARNNNIKFNNVHEAMLGSCDTGAFSSWGSGKNNIYDNNRVYDSGNSEANFTGGFYLDATSDYFAVKNNIVYNIISEDYGTNTMRGVYNDIVNNIFINNKTSSPDLKFHEWAEDMHHHTYTHNIQYSNAGSSCIHVFDPFGYCGPLFENASDADYNVYYHTNSSYNVQGTSNWFTSYNANSCTGQDPLFKNMSIHDYTLESGSPALTRGFTNINQSDIGIKSDFPSRDAYRKIEAEKYNSMSGITKGAVTIESCDNNDWVCYKGIEFKEGANIFVSNVAVDSQNEGNDIEIRLGSPSGTLAGTMTVSSTGGFSTFETQYCNVDISSGTYDVYLVFKNGTVCNMDWFNFCNEDLTFSDGFEDGFYNWDTVYGTPTTSSAQKHSGSYSYVINEDQDAISKTYSFAQNKKVTVWYYDDASDTDMRMMCKVDDGGAGGYYVNIGVYNDVSTTKYSAMIGTTGTAQATTVDRTTGWHKFEFDYTSGTEAKVYIDGTLIGTTSNVTSYTTIKFGDFWQGSTGTFYFDDVQITE